MKTRRVRALVLFGLTLALGATACAEIGPDVGEALDAGAEPGACVLEDSDPEADVRWADVKGVIFEKRCGCHMTPSGFGATVGGLLLADRDSALKGGRHMKADPEVVAIEPGDPCGSYIVAKTGTTPPFGARMPLSAKPLSGEERQLLIDWIAEGAMR